MAVDFSEMKPGDEVDAWCGKCNDMKLHKIKALPPGKDPRVICIVCTSEHNFREQPSKAQPAARPRAKKTKVEEHNPWQELTSKFVGDGKPYSISDHFDQGDFIQHHRYGLGVVTEILDTSKIVVAFEDKKRVMVCNK